ncbi:sensor histidine kinase [Kineococcus sp. SYSU DK001]|uniref:sensor histidine kinase n=1 Tax=Kineococcus sp. SYSU DK001 TaxID=3383122 RepID=UPI003D7EF84F
MPTGPVRRPDVLLAAGTGLLSLALLTAAPALTAGEALAPGQAAPAAGTGPWWLTAALLTAQAAALVPLRAAARTTLLVVAASTAVLAATAPAALHGIGGPALVVAVAVTTATARVRTGPALAVAALVVAVGEVVGAVTGADAGAGGAALQAAGQAAGLVGLPALGGLVVRTRLDLRRARDQERAALLRERHALVEAAVARERTAMARELHDIAAHHLSGIALMAAVVDRQLDTDPARAREGVRQIRAQSTGVLDDLRRLVGLLREDTAGTRSVESLDTLPDLVERVRERQPVVLRRSGPADPGEGIGPLAQLAAYRAVQEALSNAAVHAPGAECTVELRDLGDRLVVSVVNAPPERPAPRRETGGFGLRGMRERADLVGARVRYGPTPEGGWSVELELVREAST